jgi:hypothetical protein
MHVHSDESQVNESRKRRCFNNDDKRSNMQQAAPAREEKVKHTKNDQSKEVQPLQRIGNKGALVKKVISKKY